MRRAWLILVVGMLCFSCATPAIVATQTIQKGDAANNENRYEEAIDHELSQRLIGNAREISVIFN